MKGMLKHISPLAPDDSGACSVLYELGGITVICDAGGCAGNVCGFDEPRWFMKRSALFSAGLRDMDAILGRDELLVKKLAMITEQVDAQFTAIVGTPVPAVIATDLKAIERMSEKRTGLPCIAIRTDGTKLYDKGEEMAYMRLFERFAEEGARKLPGSAAVIGATPLETGFTRAEDILSRLPGYENAVCLGMDSGLGEIRGAGRFETVIAAGPGGVKAARELSRRFGSRVVYACPLPEETVDRARALGPGSRVLIIHQQIAANSLRELLPEGCRVTCGSMFTMDSELSREGDLYLPDEEDVRGAALSGEYDVIIADRALWKCMKGTAAQLIDFPHFAVSGRLNER